MADSAPSDSDADALRRRRSFGIVAEGVKVRDYGVLDVRDGFVACRPEGVATVEVETLDDERTVVILPDFHSILAIIHDPIIAQNGLT